MSCMGGVGCFAVQFKEDCVAPRKRLAILEVFSYLTILFTKRYRFLNNTLGVLPRTRHRTPLHYLALQKILSRLADRGMEARKGVE